MLIWLARETRCSTSGGDLRLPFTVTVKGPDRAVLKVGEESFELRKDVYTDWLPVGFRGAGVTVRGVCKFLLLGTEPDFGLYVTPINIDPERPVMPVSYPSVYSVYLAKKQGAYATLGLAEDTWALNEGVLNDDQFIQQCLDMDAEREAMFLDALEKVPRGLVACVFDGTDRLQHTFWRDIDETHPARPDAATLAGRNVIEDLYRRMDDLVGKTVAKCRDKGTMLMVISDHGFGPFRTGVDLNRWLEENGYLVVDDARRGEEHLAAVDWSRTRAFAIGLAGIFINLKDKYSQGIVEPGEEADRLRSEIAGRSEALVDPASGNSAVKRMYIAGKFYKGPYKDNAPDLIAGYQRGYRVSWEAAIGKTTRSVFQPNTKAWSGDHCVDPSLVPGIFFCSHPIANENPRLIDIAPTVLSMFGVTVPEYMDGKAHRSGRLCQEAPRPAGRRARRGSIMSDTSGPKVTRRALILGTAGAAAAGAAAIGAGNYWLGGRRNVSRSAGKKVIIIGIDGMDPRLSQRMMKEGLLPNLEKLRAGGGFSPLGTSTPPQSPVAWANFINGAGPGDHGIFDFILVIPRSSVPRFTRPRRRFPARVRLRSASTGFRSISGRSTTSRQPRCSGGRACRSGITLMPRVCRRLSMTSRATTRRARRIMATTVASAAWALRICWGRMVRTSISPRTDRRNWFDEGGGKRSRLTFEGDTAPGRLIGPEDSLLKKPKPMAVDFLVHRDRQADAP